VINKFLSIAIVVIALVSTCNFCAAQGLAVNTTGASADTSAMLDVKSTTRGLLPPRMTTAQRNAISGPAKGLVVYQTDGNTGLYCNNGTPALPNWQLVGPQPSMAYGYFYSTYSGVPLSIPFLGTMPFASSTTSGMTYSLPNVTITSTGVYHILFKIMSTTSNKSFGIQVNGVTATPSFSNSSTDNTISGDIVLSLAAGDVVSLINTSFATVTVSTTVVFCAMATMSIQQIQ
jgi:hypothetical protein